MTGMECLKEEMLKRGCTKTQTESKILAVVVDILAQTGTHYLQEWEANEWIKAERAEARADSRRAAEDREEAKLVRQQAYEELLSLSKHRKDIEEYVQAFEESLKKCESAEGRDRMRCAQMFVQSVQIDSKYDNTAFIIGLSAILSGGQVAAIETLRKINPKLFGREKE